MKILADKTVIVASVLHLIAFLLLAGVSFAAPVQQLAPVQQVAPVQRVAPAQQVAPAQKTKPDLQQLPNTVFNATPVKKEISKIPGKVQVIKPIKPDDNKADLLCTINTYHDQYRTREVQNHLWHLNYSYYTPPLPTPWFINFEIVVMNQGQQPATNVPIKLIFTGNVWAPQQFTEYESLAPGEAAVIKYHGGPFGPSSTLVNKQSNIAVLVDPTNMIPESNDGNNACQDFVKFVYP